MNSLYDSILVFSHSEYREFFPALCAAFKRRYGSRIQLYCSTEQERSYYLSRYPDFFDAVHSIRFFYNSLLDPLDTPFEIRRKASAYEKTYGLLLSHLFADDRHIGLGFSPGGIHFPRSVFSRNATYWKSARAFVRLMEHFEEILERERITLVINPIKALSLIAKGRGIPQRIFTATRYRNYYYWAFNDVLESNLLGKAFADLEGTPCPVRLESQPQYYLAARNEALRSFRLRTMVYNMGYECLRSIYYHLRGYEKAKGYFLKDNMTAHYRLWSQFRKLKELARWKLQDVRHLDFIYFPLGVEPERSLTRDSPEFCHQQYAAHALAKDLPAGTFLVVKEHLTAVGPRPDDFYKSLAMMTNLILLDPLEPSLDLIRLSKGVATVTGTAGLEAAFLGIPVISFGKHNIYNVVPHVHYMSSWLQIPEAVRSIIENFTSEKETRERDGARFLQAMINISIDCKDVDFNRPLPPELVEGSMDLLDLTLRRN
jgi:hypothetical protein